MYLCSQNPGSSTEGSLYPFSPLLSPQDKQCHVSVTRRLFCFLVPLTYCLFFPLAVLRYFFGVSLILISSDVVFFDFISFCTSWIFGLLLFSEFEIIFGHSISKLLCLPHIPISLYLLLLGLYCAVFKVSVPC